jgi:hypothetical protein
MPMRRRHAKRNVLRRHLSQQDRAKVCRALHLTLEIEATKADTARRNAKLRMSIGLPPFQRRTIDRELCQ